MQATDSSPLLALDIGTHKVAGLLAAPEPGPETTHLRILAAAIRPQMPQAMRDGQIESVEQVAETVGRVLQELRQQHPGPLPDRAAVAAAGRSLKTAVGSARRRLPAGTGLDETDVRALEMEALQEAARTASRPFRRPAGEPGAGIAESYLCAGYQVVEYRLDGLPVVQPVGQRGRWLEADVIGTFLPRRVLDALLAVLDRVGLQPGSLTLEPIAALELAVPATLRHLNLALVDVGAGTSDLALTRAGRVIAYGMVAEAGDRVTHHLASRYLLDLREAERLKRALRRNPGELQVVDVLGERRTLAREEVLDAVAEVVAPLASRIASECLRLNGGQAPEAILLVGGGSLTPGLPEALAEATGVAPGRVVCRDRRATEGVVGFEEVLGGPDAITPLGIAVVAWRGKGLLPLAVQVNGQRVLAFGDGARATVYDVLAAAGLEPRDLLARPGASLTVEVNGQLVTVPGEEGRPAVVRKNGQLASPGDWVQPGDHLEVEPARWGRDASATVGDVCRLPPPLALVVQGQPVEIAPEIWLDGQLVSPETPVADRSRLEIRLPGTVGEVLKRLGAWDGRTPLVTPPLRVWVNDTPCELRPAQTRVWVNGEPADPDRPLRPGDRIDHCLPGIALEDSTGGFQHPAADEAGAEAPVQAQAQAKAVFEEAEPDLTVQALLSCREFLEVARLELPVVVNGNPVRLDLTPCARILVNGQPSHPGAPLRDGDRVQLQLAADFAPMVVDLFRVVDPRPPDGGRAAGRFWIRVNGQQAQFTTPLKAGDEIAWGWEPIPEPQVRPFTRPPGEDSHPPASVDFVSAGDAAQTTGQGTSSRPRIFPPVPRCVAPGQSEAGPGRPQAQPGGRPA